MVNFAAGVLGLLGFGLLTGAFDAPLLRWLAREPTDPERSAARVAPTSRRRLLVEWLPVVALTLLALGLRLYHYTALSLWLDEGGTIQMSHLPWPRVLGLQGAYDTHPPLYYAFVKLVASVAPDGIAARLVSVVTGALTVPVFYALARRVVNRAAALAATLVLALAPLHLWFSQEGRMYAPVLLLVTVSYLALVSAWRAPRSHWVVLYGWVTAIALYADYSAAYALAPQALLLVYLAWRERGHAARLLARALGAALAFVPWLPTMFASFQQLGYDRSSYLGVTPDRVTNSLLGIAGLGGNGSYYVSTGLTPWQRWPTLHAPLLAVVGVALALGLYALARRGAVPLLLAAGLLAGTILSAIAISLVSPGYAERAIMAALLGWALLLGAAAFDRRLPRLPRALGLAALAVLLGASLVTTTTLYRGAVKQEYRGVVREAATVAPLRIPIITASVMNEFFDAYAPWVRISDWSAIGNADAIWLAYGDYAWANLPALRDRFTANGYVRALHEYFPDLLYLDLYVKPDARLGDPVPDVERFAPGPDGDWQLPTDQAAVTTSAGRPELALSATATASLTVPTSGATLYTLAANTQAPAGGPVAARLDCLDANGAPLRSTGSDQTAPLATDGARHDLRLAVICPAATRSLRLSLQNGGAGTATFRDLQLTRAALPPLPATPTPLQSPGFPLLWRLLLLLALVTALLRLVLPWRRLIPLALALVALTLALATPAAPRSTSTSLAFDKGLREPVTWLTVALLGAGMLALTLVQRATRARRLAPALSLLLYAMTGFGLATWWYWGGPQARLTAQPYLPDLERRAVALTPALLALGTLAQLLLAWLLRQRCWWRVARADLALQLLVAALPIATVAVAFRQPLPFEAPDRVAWLAGFLVVLVAARAALAIHLLLRIAPDTAVPQRRLALALFVTSLALYWPAVAWHNLTVGITGDEPQYLAATMSLWRDHNLQLQNRLFSPEMDALVADPRGARQVHIYEDDSRDRMTASVPSETRTSLFLPLVGGPGLTARVELVNPGLEPAGTTVVFHDATGRAVATQTPTIPPGQAVLLRAPDAPGGWLSASISAGKPIMATAFLRDSVAGDELYASEVALARRCLPYAFDGQGWQPRVVVQNPLPSATTVRFQQFDAAGNGGAAQPVTIPPQGLITVPFTPGNQAGTICLTADGPVASLLLARGAPGLLVQQASAARSARVPLPLPPAIAYTGLAAQSQVVAYNPNDAPLTVTVFSDAAGGTPVDRVTIPPRGAHRFTAQRAPGQINYDTHDSGWLMPDSPMVTAVLSGAGREIAGFAPPASPTKQLTVPIVAGDSPNASAAQLELTNEGDAATMAVIDLRDPNGASIWRDKVWVCAGCVVTHQVWYTHLTDGFLTIQATQPLTATFEQRAVVSKRPFHGLGLSLVMLPGYALAGWRGALATIGLLGAALVTAMYALFTTAGLNRRTALLVAALLGCSSPLLTFATHLYVEIPATLLLVVALLLLGRGAALTPWRVVGILACAIAVPLLHTRLVPLALIILALLGARAVAPAVTRAGGIRLARRHYLWFGAGALAAALALAGIWRVEPRLRPSFLEQYLSTTLFLPHLLGVLFDRGTGLLPSLPILLLAGSGFVWLIRRAPFLGWSALALGLAQLAFVALRRDGWQLWGYPGRYILPAVPFFGLALAAAWERGFARPVKALARLLVGWSLVVVAFYLWIPPSAYYAAEPYAWNADIILRGFLGVNPLTLFPVIPAGEPLLPRETLVLVAILLAGALLGTRWALPLRRRTRTAATSPAHPPVPVQD